MSRTSNRVCEDKTGLATSSMALVVTCLIHFTMGTLFNYPEDNTRFPTLGSTLFIFATSIYTLSRRLMPCSLYIRSGTLQSICKILIVIFISNVLLVGIWIQIENLTVELSYIVHDMLVFLNICATWIRYIPCVLSNIMGAVILLWVVQSLRDGADDGCVSEESGAREPKREKRCSSTSMYEETSYESYDGSSELSGT